MRRIIANVQSPGFSVIWKCDGSVVQLYWGSYPGISKLHRCSFEFFFLCNTKLFVHGLMHCCQLYGSAKYFLPCSVFDFMIIWFWMPCCTTKWCWNPCCKISNWLHAFLINVRTFFYCFISEGREGIQIQNWILIVIDLNPKVRKSSLYFDPDPQKRS